MYSKLTNCPIRAGTQNIICGGGRSAEVIFTDLLGGTPCNQGTLFGRKRNFYTLTGVNMPMLIEFIMAETSEKLENVVGRCMTAANNGIMITSGK